MAANIMDEIFKHFPDLEDGWKEMEEKLKAEPAEREMLSLKYRERLEREMLKENLPEPEFTKAKRAESDSKVIMKTNEAKSKFVYPDKLYARTKDNITLDISYAPQTLEAVEYTRTDAFINKACDAFCKARCKGKPPRSTCTSLGTCKEYDEFIKAMKL